MKQKQTKGLNRDTIDKFYTKPVVVDLCLQLVQKTLEFQDEDLIIEPSAGSGAFVIGIKSLTKIIIFTI